MKMSTPTSLWCYCSCRKCWLELHCLLKTSFDFFFSVHNGSYFAHACQPAYSNSGVVHSKTTCNSGLHKKMYPVFIYNSNKNMKKLEQRTPLLAYYSYEKDLTILIPFSRLLTLNVITYCLRLIKTWCVYLAKICHSLLIRATLISYF